MNKYEENIKARAYEFARELFLRAFEAVKLIENEPDCIFDESKCKEDILKGAKEFMGAARISIQREKEAAHEGLMDNNHDRPLSYVNKYLEERGLIPPQTQTT